MDFQIIDICRVARALKRSGHDTQSAVKIAVGRVRDWSEGKGNVTAKTRAKAAAAIAQWDKKRAHAKADNKVHASIVYGDLYELTFNELCVVEDSALSDDLLELAAMFEDCTQLAPKTVVSLSKLSTKARKALPSSVFAIPETRSYPVPDLNHAKSALSRVAQFGTPDEQKRVRSFVCKRFKIGCAKEKSD